MPHPAKTLFADRVIYNRGGNQHVAFVVKLYDDPHSADLVFYCPVQHAWLEICDATFGPNEGQYSNPGDE